MTSSRPEESPVCDNIESNDGRTSADAAHKEISGGIFRDRCRKIAAWLFFFTTYILHFQRYLRIRVPKGYFSYIKYVSCQIVKFVNK